MIKFLGALWWDYNDKPFNYKGIICLESTIAWGFYGIGIVQFLHGALNKWIDSLDSRYVIIAIQIILALVLIDYTYNLLKVFHIDLKEKFRSLFARS